MIEAKVTKSIEKAQKLLASIPGGYEKAMARSFNRALQKGRTQTTRAVAKKYTIQQKEVRKTIRLHSATNSNLTAEMVSRGERLPLQPFKHSPKADTTGARRKRVKVWVEKGVLMPLDRAFIWRGHVFQRLGKSRLPIRKLYSHAVPAMLDNADVSGDIIEVMVDETSKRLEHETQRLLEGHK